MAQAIFFVICIVILTLQFYLASVSKKVGFILPIVFGVSLIINGLLLLVVTDFTAITIIILLWFSGIFGLISLGINLFINRSKDGYEI